MADRSRGKHFPAKYFHNTEKSEEVFLYSLTHKVLLCLCEYELSRIHRGNMLVTCIRYAGNLGDDSALCVFTGPSTDKARGRLGCN